MNDRKTLRKGPVQVAIELNSDLLEHLAELGCREGERLPSIPDLADELGISTGKLREQLEVARTMGLVEVRPKTGIRTRDYDFAPGLQSNLLFAIALNPGLFERYGVLRNHVEASFWHEAVAALEPADIEELQRLVDRAWQKLRGHPIQIPHDEHRRLHLKIFSRLENPFVLGILESYWAAYEAVGLDLYTDYSYLEQVWQYHERMVEAVVEGDVDAGYRALVEHTGLIHNRPEQADVLPGRSADGAGEAESLRSKSA